MADLTLRGQTEEALRLLRAGQPEQATAICRRILQSHPKYVQSYAILGQAYMQMGKHEEAANFFRRVLGVDPEHALAYASVGVIYEERGLDEEALWQLQRAFELSPGNAEVRRELAALGGAQDVGGQMRSKLTRGALARTYLRDQLYSKAIGELHELLAEDPTRFDLRVALAEALWHQGQLAEAEVVCEAVLAKLPNCLKANLILGTIRLNSQHDEQARALLHRAQDLDPENRLAQTLFGTRSPLPPRTVRLPVRDDELPPLDLPYLMEDETPAEDMVIEGQATPVTAAPERPAPAADESLRPEIAEESIERAERPAPGSVGPGGLSLWDVEYAYVNEHPQDYRARLDLARKLYGVGAVERALDQYAQLVHSDYEVLPDVARDLDLLGRLYPDSSRLKTLFAAVSDRLRQEPRI
ncbi:MAG: tetratricopeptide repeat protein [Chloroflexi bacterium]|nr:tetratricopeptide repeat protein [Chloroflexota bacterium]